MNIRQKIKLHYAISGILLFPSIFILLCTMGGLEIDAISTKCAIIRGSICIILCLIATCHFNKTWSIEQSYRRRHLL